MDIQKQNRISNLSKTAREVLAELNLKVLDKVKFLKKEAGQHIYRTGTIRYFGPVDHKDANVIYILICLDNWCKKLGTSAETRDGKVYLAVNNELQTHISRIRHGFQYSRRAARERSPSRGRGAKERPSKSR